MSIQIYYEETNIYLPLFVRVLRNKLTREYIKIEKSNSNSEKLESLTRGALRKAVIEGDTENGSVMAGQIAGLVKKEQSCKEIIEELMTEFDKCINYKQINNTSFKFNA